jgi:hypothetical protein
VDFARNVEPHLPISGEADYNAVVSLQQTIRRGLPSSEGAMRICLSFWLFALILAGCGGDDCTVATSCSTSNGNSYQFCNGGGADNCYYLTADGHKFHCTTCGDCASAQDDVTHWCSTVPTKPGNTTSNSNGQTCSAAVSCGTGSYQACASPTGSSCSYKTSDGHTYNCNSCADCQAAANQAVSWCTGGSTTSSGGTTSTTGGTTSSGGDAQCHAEATASCQTCCSQAHANGANYYADGYLSCACAYCTSDCGASGDVCHGGSSQTSACATCLNSAYNQNCSQTVLNSCQSNSACSAYLVCVSAC